MKDLIKNNFHSNIADLDFPAKLPNTLLEIQQIFEHSPITDIPTEIMQAFEQSAILYRLVKGSKVAVGVGSRGIANLPIIVKAVIDIFKKAGMQPFIFPAMGSHGGGTAEGQIEILSELGINPQSTGAEIKSSMEVTRIGNLENGPDLFLDNYAGSADAIFLIGRVKPHTDFSGELESGLSKMCVIGLGKKTGAEAMHSFGSRGFREFLAPAARFYEKNTKLLGGLAIIENAYGETAELKVLSKENIGTEIEKQLLIKARNLMARFPFKKFDVLVMKEIGKNISGTGMDTNVIGRMMIPREPEPTDGPDIAVIGVLRLTEESHGNAAGIGMANVTTLDLANQIDWKATYTNAITTSTFGMQRAAIPIMMSSDLKTLQVLSRGCGVPEGKSRWVFAANTGKLGKLWVSKNMMEDIDTDPHLQIVNEVPLMFNHEGRMVSPWLLGEKDKQCKER